MPYWSHKLQEMIVFQLAFEADGVEVHVAHVAQFRFLPLGRRAQQHVERVAGAAYQNVLAVDVEQAMALGIDFRSHLADAELNARYIARLAADFEESIPADTDSARPPAPATTGAAWRS